MVREGYKKTELGEIPEEWDIISLGSSCEILDNLRVPLTSAERFGIQGIYPYYGANGVLGYINQYLFDGQFVLLAEDGGYFEEFENRPIAQLVSGKFWVNNHAHILKPNQNIAIIYLFYSLVHKNITFYIQGGTRSKLNQSELKSIVIFKPPLPEQHRIATVLSTIDDCIEKTEALIAKLKQVKAGLMQDLLTRGIDDEGRIRTESTHEFKDTEIGRVPVEWEVYKIGEVLSEYYQPANMDDNTIYRLISIKRRNGGIFEREKLLGKKILTKDLHHVIPGTFLIANRQIVHGACAFVTEEFADSFVSSAYSSLIGSEKCDIEYFSWLAITPMMYSFFLNASQGVVLEKMNFHINKWLEMKIVLPPLSEQKKIVKMFISADNLLNEEENYLNKLRNKKKGLMADLLTGKVRVPDTIVPSS